MKSWAFRTRFIRKWDTTKMNFSISKRRIFKVIDFKVTYFKSDPFSKLSWPVKSSKNFISFLIPNLLCHFYITRNWSLGKLVTLKMSHLGKFEVTHFRIYQFRSDQFFEVLLFQSKRFRSHLISKVTHSQSDPFSKLMLPEKTFRIKIHFKYHVNCVIFM